MPGQTRTTIGPVVLVIAWLICCDVVYGMKFSIPTEDKNRPDMSDAERFLCTSAFDSTDPSFRGHGKVVLNGWKRLVDNTKDRNDAVLKKKVSYWLDAVGFPTPEKPEISAAVKALIDGVRMPDTAGGAMNMKMMTLPIPSLDRNSFSHFYHPTRQTGFEPRYGGVKDLHYLKQAGYHATKVNWNPENLWGDKVPESDDNRCGLKGFDGPAPSAADMSDWGLSLVFETLHQGATKEKKDGHVQIREDLWLPQKTFEKLLRYFNHCVHFLQDLAVPQHANGLGAENSNNMHSEFEKHTGDAAVKFIGDPKDEKFGSFDWEKLYNGKEPEWKLDLEDFSEKADGWYYMLKDKLAIAKSLIRQERMQNRVMGSVAYFMGDLLAQISSTWLDDARLIQVFDDMKAAQEEETEMRRQIAEAPLSADARFLSDLLVEVDGKKVVMPSRQAVKAARKSFLLAGLASEAMYRWMIENFDTFRVSHVLTSIDEYKLEQSTPSDTFTFPDIFPVVTVTPYVKSKSEEAGPHGSTRVEPLPFDHVSHNARRTWKPAPVNDCKHVKPNIISAFNWKFPYTVTNGHSEDDQIDYVLVAMGFRESDGDDEFEIVKGCPDNAVGCVCPHDVDKCKLKKSHGSKYTSDYGFFVNLHTREILHSVYDEESGRYFPLEGKKLSEKVPGMEKSIEEVEDPEPPLVKQCGAGNEGTTAHFKYSAQDIEVKFSVQIMGSHMEDPILLPTGSDLNVDDTPAEVAGGQAEIVAVEKVDSPDGVPEPTDVVAPALETEARSLEKAVGNSGDRGSPSDADKELLQPTVGDMKVPASNDGVDGSAETREVEAVAKEKEAEARLKVAKETAARARDEAEEAERLKKIKDEVRENVGVSDDQALGVARDAEDIVNDAKKGDGSKAVEEISEMVSEVKRDLDNAGVKKTASEEAPTGLTGPPDNSKVLGHLEGELEGVRSLIKDLRHPKPKPEVKVKEVIKVVKEPCEDCNNHKETPAEPAAGESKGRVEESQHKSSPTEEHPAPTMDPPAPTKEHSSRNAPATASHPTDEKHALEKVPESISPVQDEREEAERVALALDKQSHTSRIRPYDIDNTGER